MYALSIFLLLASASFAEKNVSSSSKKNQTSQQNSKTFENIKFKIQCATRTSNITDECGNVLYSATCTRCDEDASVASIQATICAQAAVRSMLPS